MTSLPPYTGPRFKLVLGKYPVLRVREPVLGIKQFSIRINEITLIIDAPHDADVREGDLLSLYTEVAIAIPQKPSEH